MKKNIAISIFLVFTISTYAQNNRNCLTPISTYVFKQKFSTINAQRSDAQKLRTAKLLAKSSCLSTAQVKQIAELFQDDYSRLAFVQEAYLSTTDKDDFYEVYNTFMYFSTVFRLHDYIASIKGNKEIVVENPEDDEMTFPEIQYPDFRRYFGKIGCKNIMKDEHFLLLAQKVFDEKNDYRKVSIANNSLYNRCFLTAQAMKMASLLKKEEDRLSFLNKAYSKVYDPGNYKYAAQLFNDAKNKQQILSLAGVSTEILDEEPPCKISDNELQSIKNQINKESFNNTKVNLAKQIIKSKKCFTAAQVTQLVRLFRYSDSQMTIAKYAYDYTTDKDNYYKVANAFSFTSDRDKLLKYINEKGR
jgi:hypothetical protein